MSELISRQKLIEELKNMIPFLFQDRDGKHPVSHEAVIEFIKEFPAQPPADQWIPCSERLPEIYQPVLVTAIKWQTALLKKPEYLVDIGYCDSEGAFWLSRARTRQYAEAWMPLPEPYKGVE